ncbi:MAG: RNA polymerase sigma factor [Chloroflexota bacterium]
MTPDRRAEVDAAFERLFASYRQPILHYLQRLLGDWAGAEEVGQDVFVRAYRALPALPADANERAWLYRIATNAAYDQLRRRRLIQWLPLLERTRSAAAPDDPEATVMEHTAVQSALDRIPAKYRAPLVLYSVQGYSVQEISTMIGISEGAVKTRLYRAREMFRAYYEEGN